LFYALLLLILWSLSFLPTHRVLANNWSPAMTLSNGDQVFWRLPSSNEIKSTVYVDELRELREARGEIKSYVTRFELDCERTRIKELSYTYFSDSEAKTLIETVIIEANRQRWAHADWNEYVKFMIDYFCE